jgi:hypothetical protein
MRGGREEGPPSACHSHTTNARKRHCCCCCGERKQWELGAMGRPPLQSEEGDEKRRVRGRLQK